MQHSASGMETYESMPSLFRSQALLKLEGFCHRLSSLQTLRKRGPAMVASIVNVPSRVKVSRQIGWEEMGVSSGHRTFDIGVVIERGPGSGADLGDCRWE